MLSPFKGNSGGFFSPQASVKKAKLILNSVLSPSELDEFAANKWLDRSPGSKTMDLSNSVMEQSLLKLKTRRALFGKADSASNMDEDATRDPLTSEGKVVVSVENDKSPMCQYERIKDSVQTNAKVRVQKKVKLAIPADNANRCEYEKVRDKIVEERKIQMAKAGIFVKDFKSNIVKRKSVKYKGKATKLVKIRKSLRLNRRSRSPESVIVENRLENSNDTSSVVPHNFDSTEVASTTVLDLSSANISTNVGETSKTSASVALRCVALPELEPSIHKYLMGPPPSDGPLGTVETFDPLPTIPPTEALDIDAPPPQLPDSNLPSAVTSDSSTIQPFDPLPTLPRTDALDINGPPPQLHEGDLPSAVTSASSTVQPLDPLPTIPPTEAPDIDALQPQLPDSNLPSAVTSDSNLSQNKSQIIESIANDVICQIRKSEEALQISKGNRTVTITSLGGSGQGHTVSSAKPKESIELLCQICNKKYQSLSGLIKHQTEKHGIINTDTRVDCDICGLSVRFIEFHKRDVHAETIQNVCPVCKKLIKYDFRKHRSMCNSCPICGRTMLKLKRLLAHIEGKHAASEINNEGASMEGVLMVKSILDDVLDSIPLSTIPDAVKLSTPSSKEADQTVASLPGTSKTSASVALRCVALPELEPESKSKEDSRREYFREELNDYITEDEEDDEQAVRSKRKLRKQHLKDEMDAIDGMMTPSDAGADYFVEEFTRYMKKKTGGELDEEQNDPEKYQRKQKRTAQTYSACCRKDLLPAFAKTIEGFDASMLLDCITEKDILVNGSLRKFVDKTEPVYITPSVVEQAIGKYKSKDGERGAQIQLVLCSIIAVMGFIDHHFSCLIDIYGPEPLKKVQTYHDITKNYISGTGLWSASGKGKKRERLNNKLRDALLNPNKDLEVLMKFEEMKTSDERQDQIKHLLALADGDEPPTPKELSKASKFVMQEWIMQSGNKFELYLLIIIIIIIIVGGVVMSGEGLARGNFVYSEDNWK